MLNKFIWLFSIPTIIIILLIPLAAQADCSKDTDCKGDRICDGGTCVQDGESKTEPSKGGGSGGASNPKTMYCCDYSGNKRCPIAYGAVQAGDACICPGVLGSGYECE
jgi:hypothetical protein